LTLVRAVGRWGLTAIAINGVIGAGIFVMPATVAQLLGAHSPMAYVLAGAAAIVIALSFAEAGSFFDRAGGPYLYAREAFGGFVGFEVGWMFLFGRLAGAGAIANAFAAYMALFFPRLGSATGRALVMAVAITAIGAMNYAGVRYGSAIVNVLTVGSWRRCWCFWLWDCSRSTRGCWRRRACPSSDPCGRRAWCCCSRWVGSSSRVFRARK
jgi:amino acid transporter